MQGEEDVNKIRVQTASFQQQLLNVFRVITECVKSA